MTTQIIWNIDAMDVAPSDGSESDVVISVHYRLLAKNTVSSTEEYVTSVYGLQTIGVYQPEDPFIPYSELTEETVIDWVKDAMGIEKVTELELQVTKKLNELMNPKVVNLPLPWNV